MNLETGSLDSALGCVTLNNALKLGGSDSSFKSKEVGLNDRFGHFQIGH